MVSINVTCVKISVIAKFKMATVAVFSSHLCRKGKERDRRSKNHVLACHSDLASPIWIKIGTTKQLDPTKKPVKA
jgi:hypothetical protein